MGQGDLIIVHSGNHLTMIRTTENGDSSIEYTIDGFEHATVSGENTFKYLAVLEGNVLRITGTVTSRAMVSLPSDNTYILADNGKTLTRLVTDANQRSSRIHKVVFRIK